MKEEHKHTTTQPGLPPHLHRYSEQPFGPSNGRRRIGLTVSKEPSSHSHRCRDYGRRAQVATWTRLPRIRLHHATR